MTGDENARLERQHLVNGGDPSLAIDVADEGNAPGSMLVPQRKLRENAMSALFTFISASRMTWSKMPLKLPRR